MITALILMMILSFICIVVACVSVYVGYRALISFIAIDAQHDEYKRYLNVILTEIEDSAAIFRTDLAKTLSVNMPETRELHNHLFQLESKMAATKQALREFLKEDG